MCLLGPEVTTLVPLTVSTLPDNAPVSTTRVLDIFVERSEIPVEDFTDGFAVVSFDFAVRHGYTGGGDVVSGWQATSKYLRSPVSRVNFFLLPKHSRGPKVKLDAFADSGKKILTIGKWDFFVI